MVSRGYLRLSEFGQRLQTYRASQPGTFRISHRRHARTVWASASRNGKWDNLDTYQIVGISANEDAEARSKAAIAALDTLFNDLLNDPECSAIKSHLTVLKTNVAAWKLEFLKKITGRSQEIYRAVLYPDNRLWDTCEGYWKDGKGFRNRVAGELEKCLMKKDHEWIHEAVDAIIRADWQDLFILPIHEQCKEPATPTGVAPKTP